MCYSTNHLQLNHLAHQTNIHKSTQFWNMKHSRYYIIDMYKMQQNDKKIQTTKSQHNAWTSSGFMLLSTYTWRLTNYRIINSNTYIIYVRGITVIIIHAYYEHKYEGDQKCIHIHVYMYTFTQCLYWYHFTNCTNISH